jgi:hypothetical protein
MTLALRNQVGHVIFWFRNLTVTDAYSWWREYGALTQGLAKSLPLLD